MNKVVSIALALGSMYGLTMCYGSIGGGQFMGSKTGDRATAGWMVNQMYYPVPVYGYQVANYGSGSGGGSIIHGLIFRKCGIILNDSLLLYFLSA